MAVEQPIAEWSERLRERIEETEILLHFELAQDIKHCFNDLKHLDSRRGQIKFANFSEERARIQRVLDRLRAWQWQIENASDIERVAALAEVIAARKSGSDVHPSDSTAQLHPNPTYAHAGSQGGIGSAQHPGSDEAESPLAKVSKRSRSQPKVEQHLNAANTKRGRYNWEPAMRKISALLHANGIPEHRDGGQARLEVAVQDAFPVDKCPSTSTIRAKVSAVIWEHRKAVEKAE